VSTHITWPPVETVVAVVEVEETVVFAVSGSRVVFAIAPVVAEAVFVVAGSVTACQSSPGSVCGRALTCDRNIEIIIKSQGTQ
jgi:hypothetical protein